MLDCILLGTGVARRHAFVRRFVVIWGSRIRIHGLPGVTALGISLGADQSFGSAALGARGEGANPPLEGSVSGRGSGSEIVSGASALASGRPDLYPWGLMAMPATTTTTTMYLEH